MKNTNSWPPSGRDFEVYRRLHVDGGSTRDVAHETNLSQTRVCQIAEKVANYLLSVVPAKENRQREQQLVVGEQVASMRVDFLYGAAMQGWRDSQGSQTVTRQLQTPSQYCRVRAARTIVFCKPFHVCTMKPRSLAARVGHHRPPFLVRAAHTLLFMRCLVSGRPMVTVPKGPQHISLGHRPRILVPAMIASPA